MGFEDFSDYIPIIVGFCLSSAFALIVMWWKGLFTKIAVESKKELSYIKEDAILEKSDALSNLMITNIVSQLEDTKQKLGEAADDLSDIKTRVAVVENDIHYIRSMIDDMRKKIR